MKRTIVSIFLSLILIISFIPVAFAADGAGLANFAKVNSYQKGQFKDVKASEWYYGSVKAAYEYGLVKGNGDGSFNVKGNITIAESIALASRLNSIYYGGSGKFKQGDVWYQVYVDYAVSKGIIKSGAYKNYNAKATRAQFATILASALPSEALAKINNVSSLPDVSSGASYFASVLKLYNAGILTGSDSAGTFNPNSNIVRTEVAAIVTRMADKSQRKSFTLISGKNMVIHFIDVGQGDSIFIDFGDKEILIDAGTSSYGNKVSSYISSYVDGKLDYVIATHMDSDHIGGMATVLSNYQVGCIIDSGERNKDTKTATGFINAAKAEGCTYTGDYDTSIALGNGAYLDIIETGDGYSDSNDNSVVSMVRYGNFKALFTGDMSSDVESSNTWKFSDVDVLKVGHHGSRTATCQSFLNKVRPEIVIISAAAQNSYGHPHVELLKRLSSNGIKAYGTYKSGTITVTTNGSTYWLNTGSQLSVSDTCDNSGNSVTQPAGTTATTYIGNSNTKKFHYATCSYVSKMAEKNKVVFDSRSAAVGAGYVGCKVCGA